MSIEKASLSLIPSAYKIGKLYSPLPSNGDGDFTFSRASTATRVSKDGLIQTVSANVPRLDYTDSTCPSLLLEPQSTNKVIYSKNFGSTIGGWVSSNVTTAASFSTAPDGTTESTKLTRTSTTSSSGIYIRASITGGYVTETNTGSIYVKNIDSTHLLFRMESSATNSTYIDASFDFSTKEFTSQFSSIFNLINLKVDTLENDWYRLSMTYQNSNYNQNKFYLAPSNSANRNSVTANTSVEIWGAQFELLDYASSYIPTIGATVTRVKDECTGAGNIDLFNSTEGVIYAEFKHHTEEGVFRQINLRLNSSNRIYISKRADNGKLEFRMENPAGSINFSFTQNTSDDYIKVAFRYSPNNFAVFINGVNKNVSSIGNTFTEDTLTTLELASPLENQNFYGKIKDLTIYNTPLTDNELIELTS